MEKLSVLYSSGNAPTIAQANQELAGFKKSLLDLLKESWVETIVSYGNV